MKDKILVVDDVEDNIKLLQYELEDEGYEVFTARDGREALEVTKKVLPDVILLDIMMPVMNGIETCKCLKADQELFSIPVIMLSAKDQDDDIISGLDCGALDYISKPLNYPIVAARVRSALRVKEYEDAMRELTEELRQAKEKAERALRARSTFLATMSHEIRTPITAIMGLSEILTSDKKSPFDNEQAASSILANSRYLLEVINNILDLSKAESGHFETEHIKCSLFSILHDVKGVVSLKANEKNLDFLIDYHYPLPKHFMGDPTRLKQVLVNFASNAIKFTREGSVRVLIRCLKEEQVLEFEVIDTGIGMDEEELSKLFKPFQQANQTITRRFGGSGLGLTISKEIIDKLEGTIEVNSEKGIGSCFKFRIPLLDFNELEMIDEHPMSATHSEPAEELRFSGRILLVEDEPMNQKLIAHMLSQVGIEVATADDGEEAVAKGSTEDFDLILMDMQLPKIDGVTASRMLKEKDVKVPIIALTATQNKNEIEELLSVGCEEYLPKPFEKIMLFDCLRRYLGANIVPSLDSMVHFDSECMVIQESMGVEVILEYQKKLLGKFSSIQEAFENENWEELRFAVHKLAGASLFGFPRITFVSQLLEQEVVKQNHDVCKDLIQKLGIEIKEATSGVSEEEIVSHADM